MIAPKKTARYLPLGLAAFLLASACTFKPASGPANGTTSIAAPPPQALLRVAWWTDDHTRSPLVTRALTVDRETRIMSASMPVTLPQRVPDRLEAQISYPTALAQLSPDGVTIQAATGSGRPITIAPKTVVVASRTDDLTVGVIDLEGIRQFLGDGTEGQLQLRILIQQPSGETPLTTVFDVRTPPAKVEITQGPAADDDFSRFTEGKKLRGFELNGTRYVLVMLARIRSFSTLPIEVTVPVATDGVLQANRRSYTASGTGPCGHEASAQDHKIALSTDMKLLPLSDELSQLVANLAGAPDSIKSTVASIDPGKTTLVGIYGTGPDALAFMDGKYQARRPGSVQLPDHCESRCPKMRTGGDEFNLCWDAVRRRMPARYPADSVSSCNQCVTGIQASCEACHSWEDTRPFEWAGPNCLFCGELTEVGNVGGVGILHAVPEWQTAQVLGPFPTGDEDLGFTLDATPDAAPLTLRFADASAADDPEFRTAPFLKASFDVTH